MASGPGGGSSGTGSGPPGGQPLTRSPTDSSFYDFNGTGWDNTTPGSQTWMYAKDARVQQANVPTAPARPYPSRFGNAEGLPLTTPGSTTGSSGRPEWQHYPLIPGQNTTWAPGSGVPPGGVRSVYTQGNPTNFDVIYHNPQAGSSGRHALFSMANYNPPTSRP